MSRKSAPERERPNRSVVIKIKFTLKWELDKYSSSLVGSTPSGKGLWSNCSIGYVDCVSRSNSCSTSNISPGFLPSWKQSSDLGPNSLIHIPLLPINYRNIYFSHIISVIPVWKQICKMDGLQTGPHQKSSYGFVGVFTLPVVQRRLHSRTAFRLPSDGRRAAKVIQILTYIFRDVCHFSIGLNLALRPPSLPQPQFFARIK